jgi:hypothetical protein
LLLLTCLLLALPGRAAGQELPDDTRNEFWPELDAYVQLSDRTRLFFLASLTNARESKYREMMVGGHVDVAVKPIRSSLRHTPDVLKRRYLSMRAGYRTRERYFAGIEWPIGKTAVLDSYYVRQDDSRSSPAHVNALGLAFNLFF